MKYAGQHRVLDRPVEVGHRALVEVLGVVQRQHVGVAELRVLLVVLPGAVLAGRLLHPVQPEHQHRDRDDDPGRGEQPVAAAGAGGVLADRPADDLGQAADEPVLLGRTHHRGLVGHTR